MKYRQYYLRHTIENKKLEQRIREAILSCSDEKETISLEVIERWVEEDKERRRLKNRISRIVSEIVEKARLRK